VKPIDGVEKPIASRCGLKIASPYVSVAAAMPAVRMSRLMGGYVISDHAVVCGLPLLRGAASASDHTMCVMLPLPIGCVVLLRATT